MTTSPKASDWAKQIAEAERSATIRIEGNTLLLTNYRGWPGPYDMTKAKNVSLAVQKGSGVLRRYVEFWGNRTQTVPVLAQGFDQLEDYLSRQAHYDAAAYRSAMKLQQEGRKTFLRRPLAINAAFDDAIATAQALQEFDSGFALLRDDGEHNLSWNITYTELAAMPGVLMLQDEYDNSYYALGKARIGRVLLDDLRVRCAVPRKDVPIKDWNCYVVLVDGRDQNYKQLKAYFQQIAEPISDYSTYERNDATSWKATRGSISINLHYWYDSTYTPESGYCWLQFENRRSYPEFYSDAYCQRLRLDAVRYAVLPLNQVMVERDFRRSPWVRNTPTAIRGLLGETAGYCVWLDEAAAKIGFANATFAVIVDRAQARKLTLQNAAPAKGGGYAALVMVDSTDAKIKVADAAFRDFDAHVHELAALTGLELEILPEVMDD